MRSKLAKRIRRDLEQRGVAPEFSHSISSQLERFSDELTPDTYDAVLSGVAMAYGVHRRGLERLREGMADVDELQRLMKGFASELAKLDEALGTLTAYLSRIRSQTVPDDRTLH